MEPPARARAKPRSIAILVLVWLVLHIGCLFSPGLLDDVDSIYIEVAREMLLRHDYVTPYVDGVRFFDKPPLMYWMAAGSMHLFGPFDWAARLPLALCVLGLFLAVYALGKRLTNERGGFYAALAMATSLGPFLFTRFYIPDVLNALWMTLGIHLFLITLERARNCASPPADSSLRPNSAFFADAAEKPASPTDSSFRPKRSGVEKPASPNPLLPSLAFATVMALNLLTKGLIGIVFPLGFVALYLLITKQLRLLKSFHLAAATLVFTAIAAPWHVLAALRNPAVPLPAGLGLPATGGWAWFYLYNEHIARFLGKRIPHDYGQLPVPLFWLMFFLWLMPWTAFLPAAVLRISAILRHRLPATPQQRENALTLALWPAMVLGFFTLSSRQEYYSLPALPALALMAGTVLARAEQGDRKLQRHIQRGATFFLLPLATLIAIVTGYFAIMAPLPPPHADLSDLLTTNPENYTLALGHLYDLTGRAMGFFRAPLMGVCLSMLGMGLIAWLLRKRTHLYAANLALAISTIGVLLCVHSGLARFYPILGSKGLAVAIQQHLKTGDRILLDGELTSGSTLVFYTRQPVGLVNGRVNGPWFGSFWPDAPAIFETEDTLHTAWAGPHRVFLLTYSNTRAADLARFAPVKVFARQGGKTVLTNR